MTIRDEDLLRCASEARRQWLESLPETVPDHDFSRHFRRKVWLSRFRAYRLYYTRPFRRFLQNLCIWLLLVLFVLAIFPFELRQNDISFMRQADHLVIRTSDDFEMLTDLEDSLLLPQTIPLDKSFRTITVNDLSIFPENAFYAFIYGNMEEVLQNTRLATVFEIDFFSNDTYLGTIRAVTPRDPAALQDVKTSNSFRVLTTCGGYPIVFSKGTRYFALRDAFDTLDDLLTGEIC